MAGYQGELSKGTVRTRTLTGFRSAKMTKFRIAGSTRAISINNDLLNASEGSTDSSRRQLQFGNMYDVFFVK